MHMVYVDTLLNGLKVYAIALSMPFIIMNILRPTLLNVVFHKDQYWLPYCLMLVHDVNDYVISRIFYSTSCMLMILQSIAQW